MQARLHSLQGLGFRVWLTPSVFAVNGSGPRSWAQRRVSVRCPAPERCPGRRGVVMGTIQGLVWVSHGVMLPLMNAKQQYRIRWLHGWDPEVQVLVRAGRKGMQQTKALRQGSVLSQESRSATRQRLPIRRTASWEAVRQGYTGFGDVMSLHFESLYVSICLRVGIGFVHSFWRPCWRGRPVVKWGTNTAYAYPHIHIYMYVY